MHASNYFQNYFRSVIGEDELQLTLILYRRNLYAKLGVSSQSQLFSLFLRQLNQQQAQE